jgi:hypothetical protein
MNISLATLKDATVQQVFDHVTGHLLTQLAKSTGEMPDGEDEGCLYRHPEGLKCAAGCLIADNEYSTGLENQTWSYLASHKRVPADHSWLITELQEVHDLNEVEAWYDALLQLSHRHGLLFNPPIRRDAIE